MLLERKRQERERHVREIREREYRLYDCKTLQITSKPGPSILITGSLLLTSF